MRMRKTVILSPTSFSASFGFHVADGKDLSENNVVQRNKVYRFLNPEGKVVKYTRLEKSALTPKKFSRSSEKLTVPGDKAITERFQSNYGIFSPQEPCALTDAKVVISPVKSPKIKPSQQIHKPKRSLKLEPAKKIIESRIEINKRILNAAKLTKKLITRKTNIKKEKDLSTGSNNIKFQQKASNEQLNVSTRSISKSLETSRNGQKKLKDVTHLQPKKFTAKTKSSVKQIKEQSLPITDVPLTKKQPSLILVDFNLLGKDEKIDNRELLKVESSKSLKDHPVKETCASNLDSKNVEPTLSTKESANQTTFHYCIRHKTAALVLESAYLTYKKTQKAKTERSASASKINIEEKPVNKIKKDETFLVTDNKVISKSVYDVNDKDYKQLDTSEEVKISVKDNIHPQPEYLMTISEKNVLNTTANFSLTYPFNIFSVLRHKLKFKYAVLENINKVNNHLEIPKAHLLTKSTDNLINVNGSENIIMNRLSNKNKTIKEIEILTHYPHNIMSTLKTKMIGETSIDNLNEVKSNFISGDEEIKMKLDVVPENINCTLESWENTVSSDSDCYEAQLKQARKLKKLLRKPSDTVKKLLRSNDLSYKPQNFLSGQFYKELNFLDSFIELLQRIDNTSISNIDQSNECDPLTEICINDDFCFIDSTSELQFSRSINNELQLGGDYNSQDLIVKNNSVSKKESLRLLNVLIQDESRRAKNLIFIIKMREKSLKDFTKSHILWLENQKKKYNGDSSVLKKKQRGYLLKLEQECDEMNRMKKTLIAKCEERKTALRQIKRNLQLMITNEESDIEKRNDRKKIKKNQRQPLPRNSPMKCFEVSSESVCSDIDREIKGSKSEKRALKYKTVLNTNDVINPNIVRESFATQKMVERQLLTEKQSEKIEKGIQTSIPFNMTNNLDTSVTDKSKELALLEENGNVIGSDLNELFKSVIGNTCEIFNNEQQYEVKFNELRNILQPLFSKNDNFQRNEIHSVENFENITDECKNKSSAKFIKSDSSTSSTNSTARSLIEELNNYFSNDGQNEVEHNKIFCISDAQNHQLQKKNPNEVLQLSQNNKSNNDEVNISLSINSYDDEQDKIQHDFKIDTSYKNSASTAESIEEVISLEDKYISGDVSELEPDRPSILDTEPRTEVINDLDLPEGQVCQREDISLEIVDDDTKDVESKVITYSSESFDENTHSPSGVYPNINKNISDEAQITSPRTDNEGQQDLWVCISNMTSPSPEQTPQGSPTGEYSPAAAAALRVNVPLPTISEAEELRRKQLAIEMEIKALEKQQSQLSYCLVREIPDKPPPPYTPPAAVSAAPGSNETFTMSNSFPKDVSVVVEAATQYFDLLYEHIEKTVAKGGENKLDNVTMQFNSEFDEFMFDLCKSTMKNKIEKHSSQNMPLTVKSLRQEREVLLRDKLLESVTTEIKHVMGFKEAANVEKAIQWIPMRGDHIDDILRQEFKKKDSEWTSLENEEVDVKEKLVDDILKMLINESVEDFLKICQKK